jgi:hypothetical protein
VHTHSACLAFPASWPINIIGGQDTVTEVWTPADSSGIYLIAVDSALYHGGGSVAQEDSAAHGVWPYDGIAMGSEGETPNFVPGDSPGWTTAFPSAPPHSSAITPGSSCSP